MAAKTLASFGDAARAQIERPDSVRFLAELQSDLTTAALVAGLLRELGRTPSMISDVHDIRSLTDSVWQLYESSEYHQAFPGLCRLALHHLQVSGPECPTLLALVIAVLLISYKRNNVQPAVFTWVLPRAAAQWGQRSGVTRELVQWAAMFLCHCSDPRQHTELTRIVTQLAQQLPGGLGWGSTVVAPVPDADAYSRHAVMQQKAMQMLTDKASDACHRLAKQMLERCVTFYEGMGLHWLACVRKVQCSKALSTCVARLESLAAAQALIVQVKRTAQRELGPKHDATLDVIWQHGCILRELNRHEAALSLFASTTRTREESAGPLHHTVLAGKVSLTASCTPDDQPDAQHLC